MSKYLARRSDGAILKENDDGTFSFIDTHMVSAYRYDRKALTHAAFEEITERDFPFMENRKNEYYAYESWASRSDGHGGCKGGTIEEFRRLPDYESRVERTKNNFK